MAGVFKIDGVAFTRAVVDKPKRTFTILDGENAGRQLLTAKMERDVLGTFYNYNLKIDSSFMTQEEYDNLFDILSAPVDSHTIEVPYGQSTLVYEAYVSKGSDELTKIDEEGNHWSELTIDFVAMSPQRTPN